MVHNTQIWINRKSANKVNRIYDKLKKEKIKIKKSDIWDLALNKINEKELLEKFKYVKKKKINKMLNDPFWEIKW